MSGKAEPLYKRVLRRSLKVVAFWLLPMSGHFFKGRPMRGASWLASMVLLSFFTPFIGVCSIFLLLGLYVAGSIDSMVVKHAKKGLPRLRWVALQVIFSYTMVWLVLSAFRVYWVEFFMASSNYMAPNIIKGDHFCIVKTVGRIQRGDVILTELPGLNGRLFVRRVIGLSGDTLSFHPNLRKIVLNGKTLRRRAVGDCRGRVPKEVLDDLEIYTCTVTEESMGSRTYKVLDIGRRESLEVKPVRVPDGHVFVLPDARRWDWRLDVEEIVPVRMLRGRPRFIWFSNGKTETRWSRVGRWIR